MNSPTPSLVKASLLTTGACLAVLISASPATATTAGAAFSTDVIVKMAASETISSKPHRHDDHRDYRRDRRDDHRNYHRDRRDDRRDYRRDHRDDHRSDRHRDRHRHAERHHDRHRSYRHDRYRDRYSDRHRYRYRHANRYDRYYTPWRRHRHHSHRHYRNNRYFNPYRSNLGISFHIGSTDYSRYRWAPSLYSFYTPTYGSYGYYQSQTHCRRIKTEAWHHGHRELVSVKVCSNPWDGEYVVQGSERIIDCRFRY